MSYHVVRGYWLVRYLEDVHPGFLRQCLAAPQPARQLEAEVARVVGVEPESFWVKIDDLIVAYRWTMKINPTFNGLEKKMRPAFSTAPPMPPPPPKWASSGQ